MKIRKVISLTALVSSLLVLLTSIVLYIVPQGRIAYWADWRLWGLSKTEWGHLHINLGFLFLAAIVWHVYLNWKAIISYLKNRTKELSLFNREFNVSLAVTVVVVLGTYFMVPPFSSIIDLSDGIKDDAAAYYGEPPYGHAELSSLAALTARTGLDLERSLERMEKAGIRVQGSDQVFLDIAKAGGMSPGDLFAVINIKEEPVAKGILPDNPPAGIGRKRLQEVCDEYALSCEALIKSLQARGIPADRDSVLKELAGSVSMSPMDLYTLIRDSVRG